MILEGIFQINGIGREVFRAITTKESATVVGIVVVLVIVYLLMNLLVDLLYPLASLTNAQGVAPASGTPIYYGVVSGAYVNPGNYAGAYLFPGYTNVATSDTLIDSMGDSRSRCACVSFICRSRSSRLRRSHLASWSLAASTS